MEHQIQAVIGSYQKSLSLHILAACFQSAYRWFVCLFVCFPPDGASRSRAVQDRLGWQEARHHKHRDRWIDANAQPQTHTHPNPINNNPTFFLVFS